MKAVEKAWSNTHGMEKSVPTQTTQRMVAREHLFFSTLARLWNRDFQ